MLEFSTKVFGLGPNIAHQWYANGCRTLEDVIARKGGIEVTTVQEVSRLNSSTFTVSLTYSRRLVFVTMMVN